MRNICGTKVNGIDVDARTRCAHYNSRLDIIAIKFKCCNQWFPCFKCHTECAAHPPIIWSVNEYETRAVLCGECGYKLSIAEYLGCSSACPNCHRPFNPNCALHYHLYFESPRENV